MTEAERPFGWIPDPRGVEKEEYSLEEEAMIGAAGSLSDGVAETISAPLPQLPFVQRYVKTREVLDPRTLLPQIKADVAFNEVRHKDLRPWDVIRHVIHHDGGRVESYADRLKRAEEQGKIDSSSYGIATLREERFVMFATHFDVMGGSLDTSMGEKYALALELAEKEQLPCIMFYASGGARQQEGTAALEQMTLMADMASEFKEKTRLPLISILIGKTYGGISASPVPLADVVGAMQGADFGFSGPDLIETFQQKKMPEGAQSEAANILNRNIDVYFHTKDAMLRWIVNLSRTNRINERNRRRKLSLNDFLSLPDITPIPHSVRFPFGRVGFANLFSYHDAAAPEKVVEGETDIFIPEDTSPQTPESQYADYKRLATDSRRLDTEMLYRMLEHPVPLYAKVIDGKSIESPAIIAAIGTIGPVGVMLLGNAHKYEDMGDGRIRKKPSSPTPKDFEYERRMLDMAERLGLLVITHADTLGASPTVEAEQAGQSREIALSIAKANRVKSPVLTLISCEGSGGGLTMVPRGERRLMFSDGMAAVAEPAFSTVIRMRQSYPPDNEIFKTFVASKTTVEDQRDIGLIDGIIWVESQETSRRPEAVIERVREEIIRFALDYHSVNQNQMLHRRRQHIRELNNELRRRTKLSAE